VLELRNCRKYKFFMKIFGYNAQWKKLQNYYAVHLKIANQMFCALDRNSRDQLL